MDVQVGATDLVHGVRITLQTAGLVKNEVTSCDVLVNCAWDRLAIGEPSVDGEVESTGVGKTDAVIVQRGRVQVEIALAPVELTIRRAGRRLVWPMGAWVADGTVHDHFIQFTEGVVAAEDLAPLERAAAARVRRLAADRVGLAVELSGGRGRASAPARRRSPLHGPRLPGRAARRRRNPPGRLRAGAVVGLEPRLRRLGQVGLQRNPVRPRRRPGVRVDPLERLPRVRAAAETWSGSQVDGGALVELSAAPDGGAFTARRRGSGRGHPPARRGSPRRRPSRRGRARA